MQKVPKQMSKGRADAQVRHWPRHWALREDKCPMSPRSLSKYNFILIPIYFLIEYLRINKREESWILIKRHRPKTSSEISKSRMVCQVKKIVADQPALSELSIRISTSKWWPTTTTSWWWWIKCKVTKWCSQIILATAFILSSLIKQISLVQAFSHLSRRTSSTPSSTSKAILHLALRRAASSIKV